MSSVRVTIGKPHLERRSEVNKSVKNEDQVTEHVGRSVNVKLRDQIAQGYPTF